MMFGEEFFPTPSWIGHKMIDPLLPRIRGKRSQREGALRSVLDPNGGDGALLDIIENEFKESYARPRMSACEISPELAAVLQSKKYDLVGHDFLEFQPDFRIDCIVMNPPFSEGPAHILHAWEILEPRGELVSLVMATNVTRPHTKEMELLASFIEQFGSFEDLGPAFAHARRPTEVPIGLIRMSKPGDGAARFSFHFEAEQEEVADRQCLLEEAEGRELAHPDRIGAIVNQYKKTIDSFGDILKARNKVFFYGGRFCAVNPWETALKCIEGQGSIEDAFEDFADKIRLGFWTQAMRDMGMEKYMTVELKKKLHEFVEQQGHMAFNKANITRMYETILFNRRGIMQQAVEAVFDLFTKFYKENRSHTEGWDSNLAWKVSRKVVLPWMIEARIGGGLRPRYGAPEKMQDIDKVMCYLSGKKIEEIVRIDTAIDNLPRDAKTTKSTFFKLTAHKKGTLHLEFLDEALWNRVNIEACQGKGWIGKE